MDFLGGVVVGPEIQEKVQVRIQYNDRVEL